MLLSAIFSLPLSAGENEVILTMKVENETGGACTGFNGAIYAYGKWWTGTFEID